MERSRIGGVVGSALALALGSAMTCGCSSSQHEGEDWVRRVVKETPRIVQLVFRLPSAPASSYNATGRYPDWIGDVTYSRFHWSAGTSDTYRADATADVAPGPGLAALLPPGTRATTARVDLTVDFVVQTTPPPIIFLPSGRSLQPMHWTVHRVDGRSVEETGGFVEYDQ